MPIDLNIIQPAGLGPEIEPQALFRALPERADRYEYLRDVQDQVLTAWFDRRDEQDLLIKMNTGGGKTVVGLLALQSALNEGRGPVAYLTPDRYLAEQVRQEAARLGLRTADEPRDPAYETGEAILVATVAKLFTGRSVFGVGRRRQPLELGVVLFDDAHSTVGIIEQRFTATIPASNPLFERLLRLFEPDLKRQSQSGFLGIESRDPSTLEVVPFWAWRAQLERVARMLHERREDEPLRFSLDLLEENLDMCTCIFSGTEVAIRPLLPVVQMIPSFVRCRSRIFMTATLADESTLVSHLGASVKGIGAPITPKSASDLGERLILAPLDLNPTVSDAEIERLLVELSKDVNVALICPSRRRADRWRHVAAAVADATNLDEVVADMRAGHVGLAVFIGKYDGVDLPGAACRVLVLDGLPEAVGLHDRLLSLGLAESKLTARRQVQRIEQGMGRGVRSEKDHCVVLLLGAGLTRHVYRAGQSLFSEATAAQLGLSKQIANQLEGKGLDAIREAIRMVLDRDAEWVRLARAAVSRASYPPVSADLDLARDLRRSVDAAYDQDWTTALNLMQKLTNEAPDVASEGWFKQYLAMFKEQTDPTEAQRILRAAYGVNKFVVRPLATIPHTRLTPSLQSQASRICQRWAGLTEADILLEVREITSDLIFEPETATTFETAFAALGEAVGFESARPERDEGRGPDVLWGLGEMKYLVVECKNGATVATVSKSDANQLAGSMNWFGEEYDATCSAVPVLIHPSRKFDSAGTPPQGTRVITTDDLARLRGAFEQFATAAATHALRSEEAEVARRLRDLQLTGASLLSTYSSASR